MIHATRRALDGARDLLERFFLAPTTGEAGAAFRAAFGALLLYYLTVGVGWNLERYWGESGTLPFAAYLESGASRWSLLALGPSTLLLRAVWMVTLAASAAFALGIATRWAAAAAYVGTVSFYNRNPWLMNAGDHLVTTLCFLSIFAPLSLCWSASAWLRARRREPAPPPAPVFFLAVIRLQIVFIYLASFGHKVTSAAWRSGDAVSLILESSRFAGGGGGTGSELLERAFTYGTLVVEGAFALVLVKRFRPWLLAAGVALHLSIEALMRIPMFTAVMLVSYLALLDDGEVRRFVGKRS